MTGFELGTPEAELASSGATSPPFVYEPVSEFGAILIDLFDPWITLHFCWYLDAIGVMVDPVYQLVYDQGVDDGTTPTVGTYDSSGELIAPGAGYQAGYASALDPQQATAGYGFLGQFVGVQVPAGADNETAESLVVDELGWSRGTPAAVKAAAKRNLSGTQTVGLLERTYADGTPNAGWFVLTVRPEEVISESALIAAVNATKLGGLMWTLIQDDAPLFSQYTRLLSNITVDLADAQLSDVT